MIVDASPECHKATFDIGGGTTSREWDIKVTQYSCSDMEGGPDGCLQYFTGTSGRVSSFNYPTTSSSVGSTVTHLSNQMYTMCFRQERGYCGICFIPAIVGPATATTTAQSAFGLSNSVGSTAIAQSEQNLNCPHDYLEIPHAVVGTTAVGTNPASSAYRLCGRNFAASDTATAPEANSICSYQRPFRIRFVADDDEITEAAIVSNIATPNPSINEQDEAPGGIIGFSLTWTLKSC